MSDKLVRKYIHNSLLKEEDGYDYGYDFDGGYGWEPGVDAFNKAFVQPFTDVLNTVRGETEKALSKTQTLFAYIIRGLAVSLIPFMKADYSDIDEADQARLEKIKSKYADVYKRTDEAFQEEDFHLALFLWRPHQFMAADQVFVGPNAALKALEIISGGNEYVTRFANALRDKMKALMITKEGVEYIHESPKFKGLMKKVLANPQIQKALKQSKILKQMREDSLKLISHHVQDVISHTKSMLQKITSPDGITKIMESKMKKETIDEFLKLNSSEKQKIIKQTQKMIKGFYILQLKSEASHYQNIDKLNQIFQKGISAIKSM